MPVVAVLVLTLVAPGAGATEAETESGGFPTTIQNCGEEITIFQAPERIMTVGNIAVNLLYAAGVADRIAVRAGPHDGPLGDEAAAAVADAEVLDDDDPSIETIIGSGVDTVVSYGLSNAEGLAEAGISSYVSTMSCQSDGTFSQVFDEVERLGELMGTEDDAGAAVEDLRDRIAAVEAGAEGSSTQTAASVYFYGETLSINGNKNISQAMMGSPCLVNVFADLDADFSEGNLEELIDADPEVIILSYGWIDGRETFEDAKRRLVSTPGMADVRAVVDGRIVGNPSSQAQNDPAAVDGLEEIAEQLARSR